MAKKIGAIVSLSIIGILIILTIVMANVKVNHRVYCEKPQNVWVYTEGIEVGANEEQASKIVEYINEASKENCLSALFSGNLDATADVVTESGIVSISSDKYYVRYHYSSEQVLTEGKSEYKDGDGNMRITSASKIIFDYAKNWPNIVNDASLTTITIKLM